MQFGYYTDGNIMTLQARFTVLTTLGRCKATLTYRIPKWNQGTQKGNRYVYQIYRTSCVPSETNDGAEKRKHWKSPIVRLRCCSNFLRRMYLLFPIQKNSPIFVGYLRQLNKTLYEERIYLYVTFFYQFWRWLRVPLPSLCGWLLLFIGRS